MNSKIFSDDPIIAIDIGTTKICVLVAQHGAQGTLEIRGIGKAPSEGLKKGIVVDIEKTVHSIKKAVSQAELMAGCTIESACIGISGSHIQSINSQGVVPIKRSEVKHRDVENVIASAQAVPIAEGQQILHVLPQYFVIDSQERVQDPVGMHGVRLEAQVHIITGSIACVQNLVKCCSLAGITVNDIILEQLASALAVVSYDERRLGIGMLDIGGGTSDFALYHNGSIFYTMVVPVAGNQCTRDIALGLRTTLEDAERIKKEYGFVMKAIQEHDDFITVEAVEGGATKQVMFDELGFILQARVEELFTIIHKTLIRYNLKSCMPAGLVLTGGGSLLKGMPELASSIFNMPVRLGSPRIAKTTLESLDNPIYATGYGLLLFALSKQEQKPISAEGPLLNRLADRMKSWVSDFF